jgi:hypothetical protein
MTQEEAGDLPPGRELDALIAEARGLDVVALDWPCWVDYDTREPYPSYSYGTDQGGPAGTRRSYRLPTPPPLRRDGVQRAVYCTNREDFELELVPAWSTDDDAAMQLLADLEGEGYHTQLRHDPLEPPDWRYGCALRPPAPTSDGRMGVSMKGYGGHGPSRALAVSRAVLWALLGEAGKGIG